MRLTERHEAGSLTPVREPAWFMHLVRTPADADTRSRNCQPICTAAVAAASRLLRIIRKMTIVDAASSTALTVNATL